METNKPEIVLNSTVENFLDIYVNILEHENKSIDNPIGVDELATKLAKLYEKARRIIDWKDEHLVRRTAIERILKRRLFSEISGMGLLPDLKAEKMAEPLVFELVRSGYFSNNRIPKTRIAEIERVIRKYINIVRQNDITSKKNTINIKLKVEYYNWLLEIASCEIEEVLDPAYRQNSLLNFMTNIIYKKIRILPENYISNEKKLLQIYIAVHKTLFGLDTPYVYYNLIKYKYPEFTHNTEEITNYLSTNMKTIKDQIDIELEYNKADKIFKICDQYDTIFMLVGDVLLDIEKTDEINSIKSIFHKPDVLLDKIKKAYDKRHRTLRGRLFRSAVYSTLSIFLAGSVSLFIIEVPLAKLIYGNFNLLAITVDIMLPTILMLFLVLLIKPPKSTNKKRVIDEVQAALYKEATPIYEVELIKQRNRFLNFLFRGFSFLIGGISLYFIYFLFKLVDIPWTSLYIDTINVAMIVFAAMLIRQKSKELTIEEGTGVIEFLIDTFSIPLAKIGQWFSEKWKEYNFVSVFFTVLIDTPFSTFIFMIEDWREFIKQQKSGIY